MRESSYEERLRSPQDNVPVRAGIIPYYPATDFAFALYEPSGRVYLHVVWGPRFARGWLMEFGTGGKVTKEDSLWVS
jgi:hypothetical protein